MPIAKNFSSIYRKNWDIYFSQCYPNGFLKLPELSNIIQLTASGHADTGGVGFADLSHYNQSWVLNRMRVEIENFPKWNDIVNVKTWIEELKGFKSNRNFDIIVDGIKLIGISTLWAIINTVKRRPEAMQIDTSHVERYPDDHATEISNRKIDLDFDCDESYECTVQFSDLDIVNHVNNTKYLEWCLNHIDPNLILENKIAAVDLNFNRELSLNDQFFIEKRTEEKRILFKIRKDSAICFACVLELR